MKASDLMTTKVVTIEAQAPIREAVRLMLQNRISGLPVVDKDGGLVGVVTEGDFLRRAELHSERHRARWIEFLVGPGRLASEYTHSHGGKVEDVMTADAITVSPDADVAAMVDLMEKRAIKRLPVTQGGKLVGIVTRANLLRAIAGLSARARTNSATDREIRQGVLAEIDKEPWAPRASINVVVWDGVVHFWGAILDENQRRALCVMAENVPGVLGVRDHLVYVEPMTGFAG